LWRHLAEKYLNTGAQHNYPLGYKKTPKPIKVKFGREEWNYNPLLPAKTHFDGCNESPLWDEN